ncbi:MAG: M48 family metallopeptidase [Opitutaceae bacterium]
MDFFEAQARAKKRSSRLVFLFALAVLGTMSAGYFAAWFFKGEFYRVRDEAEGAYFVTDGGREWFDPQLFAVVSVATLLVIGLSSVFKWLSFRQGGSAVAESVGARRIDPGRATPAERRLLNIVEEMAIASSVPMPAVYVLDQENGINAFAAGLTTSDAVVAVTKGTLDKLTRDELQGVIGHEFSHILNGDMRLNVKLTALVFGILVIGLIGRGVIWSLRGMRVRSSGSNKNSGGIVIAIFAVGLALLIIGYVGYFFGRLIQAAVSRQREFLADASAVQFTRNPAGISGALSKIGGYALGSRLASNKTTAIGHFFFAQGFKSNFGGAWATHPTLEERLRAINPSWDGKFFDPPEVVDVTKDSFATKGFAQAEGTSYAVPPKIDPQRRIAFQPAAAVADIGQLTEAHYQAAAGLLDSIPDAVREAARIPASATALVYGLLLGDKAEPTARMEALVKQHDSAAVPALTQLIPVLRTLSPETRLPLLLLSAPALRQLTHADLARFLGTLDELVHADNQITTFEFVLQKLLTHHLQLAQKPNRTPDYFSFNPLVEDIAALLSALARAGQKDESAVQRAYASGTAQLRLIEPALLAAGPVVVNFAALDRALDRIAAAALPIKKRFLLAAAHVIHSDGTITIEEGELYRAIAAAIDCPLPPLVRSA